MPVAEAPADDDMRPSYNLAPGYHGLVYRARDSGVVGGGQQEATAATTYQLQSMQWGLVPFWSQRSPDDGTKRKTINCRDDSLFEDGGMWTTIKRQKRCIVVAQGFYEWLRHKNAKDKQPYFTRRKDGQLMCFAGLWDCVQFQDAPEKLFTYTIITTDSNRQLAFLHNRMPVILENGSEAIRTWLNPRRTEWSKELQSLLHPFDGELDVYPVSKEVGKVGNNSPSFLMPVNSTANRSNIANFFVYPRKPAQSQADDQPSAKAEHGVQDSTTDPGDVKIQHDINEKRDTTDRVGGTETNAPMPVRANSIAQVTDRPKRIKRERSDAHADGGTAVSDPQAKRSKPVAFPSPNTSRAKKAATPAKKAGTRSATSNGSAVKIAQADATMKITSFFSKK